MRVGRAQLLDFAHSEAKCMPSLVTRNSSFLTTENSFMSLIVYVLYNLHVLVKPGTLPILTKMFGERVCHAMLANLWR